MFQNYFFLSSDIVSLLFICSAKALGAICLPVNWVSAFCHFRVSFCCRIATEISPSGSICMRYIFFRCLFRLNCLYTRCASLHTSLCARGSVLLGCQCVLSYISFFLARSFRNFFPVGWLVPHSFVRLFCPGSTNLLTPIVLYLIYLISRSTDLTCHSFLLLVRHLIYIF